MVRGFETSKLDGVLEDIWAIESVVVLILIVLLYELVITYKDLVPMVDIIGIIHCNIELDIYFTLSQSSPST